MALTKSIVCFLLISIANLGKASTDEPLKPAFLLQKLSLKLRGTSPAAAEIAEFRTEIEQSPSRFLEIYQKKVRAYLKSREFATVVEDFHSVWWRLPKSETTRLASYLVTADKPYFEIFKKNYMLLDGSSAIAYQQANIRTEEPLPKAAGDWRVIRLERDENRFHSIFSNLDFLNRYPDTASNRNRTRSNYIFRTFLCEILSPPPNTKTTTLPSTPAKIFTASGDEHGTNPDCMGCHYRLDPMARFFDHWRPMLPFSAGTWYDVSQAAIGKVVMRDDNGKVRSYDGVGESDLGNILSHEVRVPQCVASKTWEFIFGTGVKLALQTQNDLVTTFSAKQNFKDVVFQVVNHPYFWSSAEVPLLKFDDIKSNLQVCTGCHLTNGSTEPKFDPQSYPFYSDLNVNFQHLKRLWGVINRKNGFKPMPPPPRPQLPTESLSRINDWISAGAIDNQGHSTLSEKQISEVLDD